MKKTIVAGRAVVCSGLKSTEIEQYQLFPELLEDRETDPKAAEVICTATVMESWM